jgi:DNA processing protein
MEPSDDSTLFWLALTRVEGLGARGAHQLVQHFGSAQAVYMASLTELEACGLPARVAQAIFAQAGQQEATKEREAAGKAGARLVTYADDDYPPLLKQIPDPPLVLYLRGDVKVLAQHAVAIVGTRKPTAYGQSVAHRLAGDLAQREAVEAPKLERGRQRLLQAGSPGP